MSRPEELTPSGRSDSRLGIRRPERCSSRRPVAASARSAGPNTARKVTFWPVRPRSTPPSWKPSHHTFPPRCARVEPLTNPTARLRPLLAFQLLLLYSPRKFGGDMPNQLFACKSIDELHEQESK